VCASILHFVFSFFIARTHITVNLQNKYSFIHLSLYQFIRFISPNSLSRDVAAALTRALCGGDTTSGGGGGGAAAVLLSSPRSEFDAAIAAADAVFVAWEAKHETFIDDVRECEHFYSLLFAHVKLSSTLTNTCQHSSTLTNTYNAR
jgi:hypothetical protein